MTRRNDAGKVALDDRYRQGAQGIQQGDGGVPIAGRVYDKSAARQARLLHPLDQFTLVIGLAEHDRPVSGGRARLAGAGDVVQGRCSVDFRLPLPQKVEIGAVQHIDRFRHSPPPVAQGLVVRCARGHKQAQEEA